MGSRSTFTRKTHSSSARAADTTNDFADVHHAKKLKVNEIEKYQETTNSYISILDPLDFEYIEDAIASVAVNNAIPKLDTPATPERVLWAVQNVQQVVQPELAVTVELNEEEK